MAVFTACVHGGVRTVYMAVYTAVHGVYGPCTPACKGHVHGASRAVYRVHLHGRVPCTRLCLRPAYTARERPCTVHERGRLCKRSEAKAEAEAKAETDAKAAAKAIVTRPRLAVFVYNSGSTDLLGQRDLLRSFETANYLILAHFKAV